MKSKILVIPGGFVPYNDTVTLLSYKHLRNIDADFDVVALKGKEDIGLKESLESDNEFKKFHIEYVCNYDDAVATFERKNVISGVFNLIKYCLVARKKAKNNHYDIVYTSSIPAFTHLAGYLIKKMYGKKIKWIASISDPLYKSPYKYDEETIKSYNLVTKIGFYVFIWIYMNGTYEKLCQKYADKVIYICEEERDFCVSNFPKNKEAFDKSMIIPLNYIKEWDIYKHLYETTAYKKNNPLIVSHFGRIYGLRKLDKFLEALSSLDRSDLSFKDKIRFYQYGEFNERYLKKVKEYKLEDYFVFIEKVPYSDVMRLMKESDALALFDTILPENQLQPYLPSKSLEYILLKKPLLIITTKRSPAYRMFKEVGYEVADDSVDSIKNSILSLFHNREIEYSIDKYENRIATSCLKKYCEKQCDERE